MEIKKIECLTCKALHPDTLYPSDDQICVYYKADEAERVEEPVIEETPEEPTPEETEQLKAQKELALRALSRYRLLNVSIQTISGLGTQGHMSTVGTVQPRCK